MTRLFITMNFRKLLNLKNKKVIFVFFAAVLLTGCGEDTKQKEYVARVNDTYLTKDELNEIVDTSRSNFYKSEAVRNWVNKEILFKEAVKDGITKQNEYLKIIEDTKKDLAKSLLLNKILRETEIKVDQQELEEFYNIHKEDFRLFYESYYINYIEFNDEDKAVQFRTSVIETNWNKALFTFRGDSSIVNEQSYQLLKEHQIHPVYLLRVLKELYPDEVSIVLTNEEGNFAVVQLIQKYSKGTIPSFKVINEVVKERFIKEKKEKALDNYINELYSRYDIDIKK